MDVGEKLNLFGEYYRAFSNETYNEIMRATEHLASDAFVVLGRKPEAERRDILDKAQALTNRLTDTVNGENPMVAALALLAAIRTVEQLIQQQADQRSKP
jgi:hypothetical protein